MVLNRFLRVLSLLISKIVFLLSVKGSFNIPRRGPVIIASNHASFLDPVLLGAGSNRVLAFMAKEELFSLGLFSKLISNVGAFPIKRAALSKSTIKQALNILNAGKALVIFPQGSRSEDSSIKRVEPGLIWIAERAGALIVPSRIYGSEKAWGLKSLLPRPYPVRVIFGKPFKADDLEGDSLELKSESFVRRISEL
jgi:1-acyl-sn-glycerol-3-phosphate acyltransferase